jgi:hypothetical protein
MGQDMLPSGEILWRGVVRLFLLCACLTITSFSFAEDAESEARATMDQFIAAFNSRDAGNVADTFHFPHVRIASGGVRVIPDKQAFVATTDMEQFAVDNDWDFSGWEQIEVIHAQSDKVHFKVVFSRYNPQGEKYVSYDSLYILQKIDGRWGIRARSSFAP